MTQRDYIAVAAMLKHDRNTHLEGDLTERYTTGHTLDRVTVGLADIFAADNVRFDRNKFYTAAGYGVRS